MTWDNDVIVIFVRVLPYVADYAVLDDYDLRDLYKWTQDVVGLNQMHEYMYVLRSVYVNEQVIYKA